MGTTSNSKEMVRKLAQVIADHKGGDTVALDISEHNSWTDYFVISTVTSQTHFKGLSRHIKEFLDDSGIDIARRSKHMGEDGWVLMDCGAIIIHLMTAEMREFYDLEKLWYRGETIYSSKSS